jgi:hypothetical protein
VLYVQPLESASCVVSGVVGLGRCNYKSRKQSSTSRNAAVANEATAATATHAIELVKLSRQILADTMNAIREQDQYSMQIRGHA